MGNLVFKTAEKQKTTVMNTFKVIFAGHFEFGSPRSFDTALKMFLHKKETYYKTDVLFNENIFNSTAMTLNVSRIKLEQVSEKSWRNTTNLMEFISQYALSGEFNAWRIVEGKMEEHKQIEPSSDKDAVQYFMNGRALVKQRGKELEAIEHLSNAIDKFDKHPQAYERRAYVHYLLGNYDHARLDYSRSIECYGEEAAPYFGKGLVCMSSNAFEAAIDCLNSAIKFSIPLQPMYWKARRVKAECLMKMDNIKEAAGELKFFVERTFSTDDPNQKWKKKALYDFGRCLNTLNDNEKAEKALCEALALPGEHQVTDSEIQVFLEMVSSQIKQSGNKTTKKQDAKAKQKKEPSKEVMATA